MGTNLDDISKDDMKDTSEIEACNVGNQGTELAVFMNLNMKGINLLFLIFKTLWVQMRIASIKMVQRHFSMAKLK